VTTWTSEPIHLSADLAVDVQATAEGVTCRKSVEGVYASDVLLTAEQAEQYGKALIEASAHVRALI
jgi:hypothetical protein